MASIVPSARSRHTRAGVERSRGGITMWMAVLALLVLLPSVAGAQDRLDAVAAAVDRATTTPQTEAASVDRMAKFLGTTPETLRAERASTKLGWGDLFVSHRIATRGGHPIDKVFGARRSGAPWGTIAEEAGVQPDLLVGDVAAVWPDAARATAPAGPGAASPSGGGTSSPPGAQSTPPPATVAEPPKSAGDSGTPFQPFGESRSSGDRTRDEIRDRMIRGGGNRQ